MKKKKSSKGKKINLSDAAEELGYYERECADEEISCTEVVNDCFLEGDMAEDKSIISIVTLF
jgi:hypothetical protein